MYHPSLFRHSAKVLVDFFNGFFEVLPLNYLHLFLLQKKQSLLGVGVGAGDLGFGGRSSGLPVPIQSERPWSGQGP